MSASESTSAKSLLSTMPSPDRPSGSRWILDTYPRV